MRALISGRLTESACTLLEDRSGWTLCQVGSVAAEVARLSDEERNDVVALIVETEPVESGLIGSLLGLEVIACLRSGPVNIDMAAATEAAVPVLFSPGRNAESVADFTLALLLAMLRGVACSHHGVLAGNLTVGDDAQTQQGTDVIWSSPDLLVRPFEMFQGPELSSLVVAVIGYGVIGAAVANRLASLVKRVVVVDPVAGEHAVTAGLTVLTLSEALALADVISLHARSDEQIIGAAQLAEMKPDAYMINTARATVLDYGALVDALRAGRLAGAALDVFPEEPLRRSSELLAVPGLTLTPHLAGASLQVVEHQSSNLLQALLGLYHPAGPSVGIPVANPAALARWRPASSAFPKSNQRNVEAQ